MSSTCKPSGVKGVIMSKKISLFNKELSIVHVQRYYIGKAMVNVSIMNAYLCFFLKWTQTENQMIQGGAPTDPIGTGRCTVHDIHMNR